MSDTLVDEEWSIDVQAWIHFQLQGVDADDPRTTVQSLYNAAARRDKSFQEFKRRKRSLIMQYRNKLDAERGYALYGRFNIDRTDWYDPMYPDDDSPRTRDRVVPYQRRSHYRPPRNRKSDPVYDRNGPFGRLFRNRSSSTTTASSPSRHRTLLHRHQPTAEMDAAPAIHREPGRSAEPSTTRNTAPRRTSALGSRQRTRMTRDTELRRSRHRRGKSEDEGSRSRSRERSGQRQDAEPTDGDVDQMDELVGDTLNSIVEQEQHYFADLEAFMSYDGTEQGGGPTPNLLNDVNAGSDGSRSPSPNVHTVPETDLENDSDPDHNNRQHPLTRQTAAALDIQRRPSPFAVTSTMEMTASPRECARGTVEEMTTTTHSRSPRPSLGQNDDDETQPVQGATPNPTINVNVGSEMTGSPLDCARGSMAAMTRNAHSLSLPPPHSLNLPPPHSLNLPPPHSALETHREPRLSTNVVDFGIPHLSGSHSPSLNVRTVSETDLENEDYPDHNQNHNHNHRNPLTRQSADAPDNQQRSPLFPPTSMTEMTASQRECARGSTAEMTMTAHSRSHRPPQHQQHGPPMNVDDRSQHNHQRSVVHNGSVNEDDDAKQMEAAVDDPLFTAAYRAAMIGKHLRGNAGESISMRYLINLQGIGQVESSTDAAAGDIEEGDSEALRSVTMRVSDLEEKVAKLMKKQKCPWKGAWNLPFHLEKWRAPDPPMSSRFSWFFFVYNLEFQLFVRRESDGLKRPYFDMSSQINAQFIATLRSDDRLIKDLVTDVKLIDDGCAYRIYINPKCRDFAFFVPETIMKRSGGPAFRNREFDAHPMIQTLGRNRTNTLSFYQDGSQCKEIRLSPGKSDSSYPNMRYLLVCFWNQQ